MSSMGNRALFIPILLAFTASASAVLPSAIITEPAAASAAVTYNVNGAIGEWRAFRQGGNYSFSQYAHFLNSNPDWPGDTGMRSKAEAAMRPGESSALVLGFYRLEKPKSGNGWTRYSEALSSVGRGAEAVQAAKEAWASKDLNSADEAMILSRFGAYLTPADHDNRVDALLFNKDPADAARLLAWTSTDRRAAFAARIAMQQSSPDAETRYRAAAHRVAVP